MTTQHSPILISLTAFGAAEVMRHGQLYFTHLSHAAGANGVEVRAELLRDPATELPAIADAARELGLSLVYSSPRGLWRPDGTLDTAALDEAIRHAKTLGASRFKMSIGGFQRASAATLGELRERLVAQSAELVIENDQTARAGTIGVLRRFFAAAALAGLSPGMTFDMGNWHFVGEDPLVAAEVFGSRVVYLHCKGVQRLPHKWIAVPLADSLAPYRTIAQHMPPDVPWAIEYPLVGDDLHEVTAAQIQALRRLSAECRDVPAST
ncbi:hypothetical protein PTE30175_00357 [Pandoraea terrae]|uniref:Xylose isomerase-like TIM barrel domain-containing protein n=1 Tax=Pandoraea terrae TaxID=1537710 RepID=A0A5E4RWA1_9BURK|nr:TIM barrel protein [Pandoraea terrae]VVD66229.1 hypothetical protein PTE30175_00357 [Pandoraea terrae]